MTEAIAASQLSEADIKEDIRLCSAGLVGFSLLRSLVRDVVDSGQHCNPPLPAKINSIEIPEALCGNTRTRLFNSRQSLKSKFSI